MSVQQDQSTAGQLEQTDIDRLYRVFLIDTLPIVREGLRSLIASQAHLTVVGESNNGQAAFESVQALQPDLIITDIYLEGWSGIETTTRILAEDRRVKVLAFSQHTEGMYLRQMMLAGASGYALKSSSTTELLKGIRIVLQGGFYIAPGLDLGSMNPLKTPSPGAASDARTISERETLVLKRVAQGYAYKEIAVQLGISTKSVETYKGRAMKKLLLQSRTDLVQYAQAQGWLEAIEG